MKEKIKFKKGVFKTVFPFMLNDFSPWQQQIAVEMEKVKNRYQFRKSARFGFEITEYGASIMVYKK